MKAMCAALIVAVMVTSGVASADRPLTPSEAAAFRIEMACSSAEINGPSIIGIDARYDDQSGMLKKHYAEFRKSYHLFREGIEKCKDAKRKNAILGYYNSDMAAVKHFMDPSGEWRVTMNLSNQQLQRCVRDYYGQTKGAECQTRLEENMRLKIKWETAP